MDWGTVVAGALGVVGISIGIAGLKKSDIANRAADESNKIAKEALSVSEKTHDFQVAATSKAQRAVVELDGFTVHNSGSPDPVVATPAVTVLSAVEARKVRLSVYRNGQG